MNHKKLCEEWLHYYDLWKEAEKARDEVYNDWKHYDMLVRQYVNELMEIECDRIKLILEELTNEQI